MAGTPTKRIRRIHKKDTFSVDILKALKQILPAEVSEWHMNTISSVINDIFEKIA